MYGTGDEPKYTTILQPVTPGSRPGGTVVTFSQTRGLPTAAASQTASGKQSIRVIRPSALLGVDVVLGKGIGFPSSVLPDKWELTIMQTLESNDDKRYYGATNESKDFYLNCEVAGGRSYPLLDMITSPPDESPPEGNPSYSSTSMASFNPNDIGRASDSLDYGAVTGGIYSQFEPSVEARSVIPFDEHSDTFRDHGLTAPRYYLTEIRKNATVRTWISTRDATKGDVYPLMMLERHFKFTLQVRVNDDWGKDTSYRFVDSPHNALLPTLYLDGDSRCPPIPSFPVGALKLDPHGKFVVANNALTWEAVFP